MSGLRGRREPRGGEGAAEPKIVALFSFRDEALFLDSLLSSLEGVVDAVVAIDDFSTDGGAERVFAYRDRWDTHVVPGEPGVRDRPVEKARARLLELGREIGGTHFVCLDADEAFTAPFQRYGRERILQLRKGEKLVLQWLAMWKSPVRYRDDASVWSNNFKDFVVCDDGRLTSHRVAIHGGRTPGSNTSSNQVRLPAGEGAVLHFQFSLWSRFQWKQAWYRCFERAVLKESSAAVNEKYAITLDDPSAVVRELPDSWRPPVFPRLEAPEASRAPWFRDEILRLFDEHGIETFLDLDIWFIPELADLRQQHENAVRIRTSANRSG